MSSDADDPIALAHQQQWDEFECMRSMFPASDELVYDGLTVQQHEQYARAGGPQPSARLQYTIRFQALGFGNDLPALEIVCPPTYPLDATVEFTVHCPFLSREQTEALHTQLTQLAIGSNGDVVVLQLYQQMLDALTDAHSAIARKTETDTTTLIASSVLDQPVRAVLARRAIYFHHIINATKRRVVRDWALESGLRGFSKIGWPGIVVVEGRDADVDTYVRRLQRLRWQQIVVRGEERETSRDSSLDGLWRLPRGFCEYPESGMAALAAACRDAGVESLFLAALQIYRSTDD